MTSPNGRATSLPVFFAGRCVFEVACGTGFWTQYAAREAASVHATDVNEETLTVARVRAWPKGNVVFQCADAYAAIPGQSTFNAGFAAFWLSHVDLSKMRDFLDAFHSHFVAGAQVLIFDERETADRPHPTSRVDRAGNRYEPRKLANGEQFEIIKNFYDSPRLLELFARYGHTFEYTDLQHFWLLSYRTI